MNSFKALVKREYWEHRGSFVYAPLIMAGIFLGIILITILTGNNVEVNNNGVILSEAGTLVHEKLLSLPDEARGQLMLTFFAGLTVSFGIVLLVVSVFFCLGSLYDERKDRSILFWKSLPISDSATVLSKFIAIVLLAPLLYLAVIIAFQLVFLIIATISAWFGGHSGSLYWTSVNLFGFFFNKGFSMFVAALWLSPVWAWCMLMSAWAKKVPFIWAAFPILMIALAEGYIFGSISFIETLGNHVAAGITIQNEVFEAIKDNGHEIAELNFNRAGEAVMTLQFWIAQVIAAVFLIAAIYTRRFRDES
ncbi:hypothetical protein [Aliikangiella maris]|uniref:Uncharacterized protein n=2 Tax=Aliikangiella maris TaxID=3162458 RepID=A0ABV3MIM5_9GAMM